MLPLASTTEPSNNDEFTRAVSQGLGTLIKLPRAGYAVLLEGDYPDNVQSLTIDLNGAQADAARRPEPPSFTGSPTRAFHADKFRLQALPLRVGTSPLELEIDAEQMQFDYRKDSTGKLWLVPSQDKAANSGNVRLNIRQRDLQEMILATVAPAAKEHGVGIEDVQFKVEQLGPRKVRVALEAAAKKFMMKAKVKLGGTFDIDDDLNATMSDLHAGSDGMIGTMVQSMVQPRLREYEGKKISLAALSMGGLRLRDLQLKVTDAIDIRAQFGEG